MTVITSISRIVRDDEPKGFESVSIDADTQTYGFAAIELRQGEDLVTLTVPHAIGVHAALGALIQEQGAHG